MATATTTVTAFGTARGRDWRAEYERHWRGYTTEVLRGAFGRDYQRHEVTASDLRVLRQVLQSLGSTYDPLTAQAHASPRRRRPPPAATMTKTTTTRRRASTAATALVPARRRSSVRFETRRRRRRSSHRRSSLLRKGGNGIDDRDSDDDMVEFPMTQVLVDEDTGDARPPLQARANHESDGDDSGSSAMSDVSYVYRTPQPKATRARRRSSLSSGTPIVERKRSRRQCSMSTSTSTFPAFTPQDLASLDQTRLESASQSLRRRLQSVSPIGRLRFSVDSSVADTSRRVSGAQDESMVLFAVAQTQTPKAAQPAARTKDQEPTDDSRRRTTLGVTPRPPLARAFAESTAETAAQEDASFGEMLGATEDDAIEGHGVGGLNVSMQSMHLSEDARSVHGDDPGQGANGEAPTELNVSKALDFDDAMDDEDEDEMPTTSKRTGNDDALSREPPADPMQEDDGADHSRQSPRTPTRTRRPWHWSEVQVGETEPVDPPLPTPEAPEIIDVDDDPGPEPEIIEVDDDFGDGGVAVDEIVENTDTMDSHGSTTHGDALEALREKRLQRVGLALSGDEDDRRRGQEQQEERVDSCEEPPPPLKASSSPTSSPGRDGSATSTTSTTSSCYSSSSSSLTRRVFRTKLPLPVESRFSNVDERRRQRRRKLRRKLLTQYPFASPEFRVELAPYQREAVEWMHYREQFPKPLESSATASSRSTVRERDSFYARVTERMRGGILADEMGLGKTICCIALICESLQRVRRELASSGGPTAADDDVIPRVKPPTLIITPLSILGQWEQELRSKTNLSVITYQGPTRKSIQNVMDFMGVDVVLSTYDTLRLQECRVYTAKTTTTADAEERQDDEANEADMSQEDEVGRVFEQLNDSTQWRISSRRRSTSKKPLLASRLHQLTWHRIILDESHLITNPSCARAQAALTLRSKRRWCVTGTPIQNSGRDLSSLMTFLGMTHVAADLDIRQVLARVMLRRLKTTVDAATAEPIVRLPEKHEEIVELAFASDLERAYYVLLHRATKRQVLRYLTPSARSHGPGQGQFMHVFELLLRLRQCCDSHALVTDDPLAEVHGGNVQFLAELGTLSRHDAALVQRVSAGAQGLVDPTRRRRLPSTKLAALLRELKTVKRQQERALVVSQWTTFLDLIADALHELNATAGAEGREPMTFARLDGRMSARERDQAIGAFQHLQTVDVLLVSLRTGGLGLNLTAATQVFIMEPSWNPSIERQAIDRAHRVGQTRPVRVVRFLMKETIEERVVELQRKKEALAAETLGDPHGRSRSPARDEALGIRGGPMLTRDDLRELFSQEGGAEDGDNHEGDAPRTRSTSSPMGIEKRVPEEHDESNEAMEEAIWDDME